MLKTTNLVKFAGILTLVLLFSLTACERASVGDDEDDSDDWLAVSVDDDLPGDDDAGLDDDTDIVGVDEAYSWGDCVDAYEWFSDECFCNGGHDLSHYCSDEEYWPAVDGIGCIPYAAIIADGDCYLWVETFCECRMEIQHGAENLLDRVDACIDTQSSGFCV